MLIAIIILTSPKQTWHQHSHVDMFLHFYPNCSRKLTWTDDKANHSFEQRKHGKRHYPKLPEDVICFVTCPCILASR